MTGSQYTNGLADEKNLFHELLIRADEKKSFLIAMGLVALAKLQGVFAQVYAVDDYIQMISGLTSLRNALISQGRFGEYWLAELFSFIGFDPIRSPLLSMVLSIFLSTYVANAILRLWRVELPDIVRVLCIVIIAAHPYTSEILTFRGIAIYHVIAYAVAIVALLLARWSKLGVVLPAFIFSAALTIYQVPLSLVAVLLCIDFSLRLLRNVISTDDSNRVDVVDRNFLSRVLVFIIGLALYVVWLKISTWGIPPHPRSVTIGILDLPGRLIVGLKLLWRHFVTGTVYINPLVPVPILAVPFILLAGAVAELLFRVKGSRHAAFGILVVLLTPLVAGFAMLGFPLVTTAPVIAPRLLPQIGLVWAGIALMAFVVRSRLPQYSLTTILGVAAFVFIAQNQQMFVDHARVGVRDHNLAILLVSRLQEQPDFASMKRIAVVGFREDREPVHTALGTKGGFNSSMYTAKWAIAPMLTELFSISVGSANRSDRDTSEAYCKEHPPWPAPEAVSIRDGLAIVCLSGR